MTYAHLALYIAAFVLLMLKAVGVPSYNSDFLCGAAACLVLSLII